MERAPRPERTRNTGKRTKLARASLSLDELIEYGSAVRDSTGCLKWLGARTKRVRNTGGYGVINLEGEKTQYVHRLVGWMNGFEPEAVLHTCDTPMCFEPTHLQAGTIAENNADMAAKGRARGGGPRAAHRQRRASWDETWISTAQIIGDRSRCVRRAAGCVIVTGDNRIVSTGFNGPPAGLITYEAMCDQFCERVTGRTSPLTYDNCVAAHAEANALMHSERERRYGGTAYISTAPCFDCAKLLANSGLAWVKTRVLPQDWYRNPKQSIEFIMSCGVNVEIIA